MWFHTVVTASRMKAVCCFIPFKKKKTEKQYNMTLNRKMCSLAFKCVRRREGVFMWACVHACLAAHMHDAHLSDFFLLK